MKYTIERAKAEVSAANARVIRPNSTELLRHLADQRHHRFSASRRRNLVGRGDATLLATVSASDPLLVNFSVSEIEYLKLTDPKPPGTSR